MYKAWTGGSTDDAEPAPTYNEEEDEDEDEDDEAEEEGDRESDDVEQLTNDFMRFTPDVEKDLTYHFSFDWCMQVLE